MVEDTPDDLVHELFAEAVLERASARPADPRHAGAASRALDQRDAPALFPRRLRRAAISSSSRSAISSTTALRALVEHAFAAVPVDGSTPTRSPPVVAPGVQVRHKELEQSHVCFGTLGLPQNHPDRYAAYALNTVLGGSMSSRLFQNVREKRGLAYAVFSGLSAYQDAGAFSIYAGCANEAVRELIDVVVAEIRQLKDERLLGRRAAAREGSPEGLADAQSREHVEPHVASGAAGDLPRSRRHARRDARRDRARDGRRRAAAGGRSFSDDGSLGRDRARQRRTGLGS